MGFYKIITSSNTATRNLSIALRFFYVFEMTFKIYNKFNTII